MQESLPMQAIVRSFAALIAFTITCAASAAEAGPPQPTRLPPEVERTIVQLRMAALADDNGYAIVEDLVTRIGPRLGGSAAEARAREWAVAMLKAQGFTGVRIEDFPMPMWTPLAEGASITAPLGQPLSVTAIGGSPATPASGVEAEVLRFETVPALNAAADASVAGRIVYIDEPMARTQDGSGYGAAVAKRRACGPTAKRKGAVACLIRAVGTNTDRFTHQGMGTAGTSQTLVPTLALAAPDADILTRQLALSATPVRVRVVVASSNTADAPSGNVLAEVRGRERPDEIVLAAAHLDSWTLGQGAVDDGAGIAIITAAARLINDLPQKPKRTIRLLLAGSEEQGGFGGIAYGAAHAGDRHVAAAESDAGAGPVFRIETRVGSAAVPHVWALQRALGPLAIVPSRNDLGVGAGGTDIDAVIRQGTPLISLDQDMTRYFDVHHTANDTMAEVTPAALRQNIAAWAVMLYLVAEMDWDLRAGTMPAP
jgi:carboxypeptidase Q